MTVEVLTNSPDILPLKVADVASYLHHHNWTEVSHPNSRLLIFQTGSDDQGNPIQLVLPSQDTYEDAPYLITKSINLLASLQSQSMQETLETILQFRLRHTQNVQTQN